jgi:6-phosphogluconolactonase
VGEEREEVLLRIGCYTGDHQDRGIVTARVAADGSGIWQAGVVPAREPSYLAACLPRGLVYAVGETEAGALAAFRAAAGVGDGAGALEPLNTVGSGGADPCHLTVAGGGGFLAAANYSSGSVVVRRLRADGSIGEQTCLIQHQGRGPVPGRQEGPHTHMVQPAPGDDWTLLVTDLGADAVCAYRLDPRSGELSLASRTSLRVGSGPRHVAFHPAQLLAYVLCELDSTLVTCAWDRATSRLTPLGHTSVLGSDKPPADATCSAVRVSPDGRFLYTACRGPDVVTVFSLADAAAPERTAVVASGGACPRDMALAAAGRLLICANQEPGAVTVFRIDPDTGVPAATGAELAVPAATCVLS